LLGETEENYKELQSEEQDPGWDSKQVLMSHDPTPLLSNKFQLCKMESFQILCYHSVIFLTEYNLTELGY
jgi:hypothetical protein